MGSIRERGLPTLQRGLRARFAKRKKVAIEHDMNRVATTGVVIHIPREARGIGVRVP
jgi:hypothetical protein